MPVRALTARALGTAVVCGQLSIVAWTLVDADGTLLVANAETQSKQEDPLERARAAVDTLIAHLRGRDMPAGIVKSNGRIEATQVDVSSKYPGRLATLTKDEGDEVTAGEVVATISSPETEAQLRAAGAQVVKAKQALAAAVARIAERTAAVDFTRTDYERAKTLLSHGNISQQITDLRRDNFATAEASLVAANADRDQADASINAAQADVERLQSVLADLVLVSPRSGRVQYRLARAGEVVAPGQRILTILDLKDVYMTLYLPADTAGKLTMGDEARIILDSLPQFVVPATISFVATDAQFTPKSVETAEERQKLMFRIKLLVDAKVLDKYHRAVKTGVRGLGFVRTDPKIGWPPDLVVKLPE